MKQRTVTQQEVKAALVRLGNTRSTTASNILSELFPPLFNPKKGEVIWVGRALGWDCVLKVFSHMTFDGSYACYTTEAAVKVREWGHAHPQTPAQRGNS
jgi:hypothetical protein